MKLDLNFFTEQIFDAHEIEELKIAAGKQLAIAKKYAEPEIAFHFAYMALIKIGIFLLARKGYRVKSRPGHHQKIIEAIAALTGMKEITVIGDKMRKDRNMDVYSSRAALSEKETREYLEFVDSLYQRIKK